MVGSATCRPPTILSDSIDMIKTADDLGFYACYSVDEIYKDMWLLFAGCGRQDPQHPHGPQRHPRDPARPDPDRPAAGHPGRAHRGRGRGRGQLRQPGDAQPVPRPVAGQPPPGPGQGGHVGPSGPCSTPARSATRASSSSTRACSPRPVQGRCRSSSGPWAGRAASSWPGRSPTACTTPSATQGELRVRGRPRPGAERAGRNVEDLDLGAWVISVVANDRKLAKDAARIIVAFYIPSMPQSQVERHGIEYANLSRSSTPSPPGTWPRRSS